MSGVDNGHSIVPAWAGTIDVAAGRIWPGDSGLPAVTASIYGPRGGYVGQLNLTPEQALAAASDLFRAAVAARESDPATPLGVLALADDVVYDVCIGGAIANDPSPLGSPADALWTARAARLDPATGGEPVTILVTLP